jgi:hypothetical protein
LNVISAVPFDDGNEEYAEIAIGHKDLIFAITSAQVTDYSL